MPTTRAPKTSPTVATAEAPVVVAAEAPRKHFCFDILDAEKILRAARSNAPAVAKKGATAPVLDRFAAQIELAKQLDGAGHVSLDAARSGLKDLVVDYRDSAGLACDSLDGFDHKLAKRLLVDVPFPRDDASLARYAGKLVPLVAKHSARLADYDLALDQQQALAEATGEFGKALKARPAIDAEQKKKSQERAAALLALRRMTSFVRRAGRVAFKRNAKRAAFDRAERPTTRASRAQVTAEKTARAAARATAKATAAQEKAAAQTARRAARQPAR